MRKVLIQSLSLMVFVVGVSGGARAAEVQRVRFAGSQAVVGFFGSAAITCTDGSPGFVSAVGSLSGAEQVFASSGAPPSMANGIFVAVDSYSNSCTGQILGGASGGITNGFTPPDKKLNLASMVGSTTVQDFSTGDTLPVVVDIDVIGEGSLTQSKSKSKTKVTGSSGGTISITNTRSANSNRSATGDGTISIGGVAIEPEFFFGILVSTSNAERVVTK